ncbi:hypothetical protein BH18ACT15_BH18ACT15_02630 [soil metagenome]
MTTRVGGPEPGVAADDDSAPSKHLDLSVDGMTCATCAARVEKILSRQPGVDRANVNFASGKAMVAYRSSLDLDALLAAVDRIGYRVAPLEEKRESHRQETQARDEARWRQLIFLSWPLALGTMILSLLFMEETWARWTILGLATPVQFVAGWPFLRVAAERAGKLSANMDTLISMGTLTAFLYSVYELFAGGDIYFDTAALIIAFIVLGRYC